MLAVLPTLQLPNARRTLDRPPVILLMLVIK